MGQKFVFVLVLFRHILVHHEWGCVQKNTNTVNFVDVHGSLGLLGPAWCKWFSVILLHFFFALHVSDVNTHPSSGASYNAHADDTGKGTCGLTRSTPCLASNCMETQKLKIKVHGSVHRKRIFKCNQQDATLHNLFISVKRSTCFRRFLHQSSGAQNCIYSIWHFVKLLLLPGRVGTSNLHKG
jgi:hypothetical protein